MEFPRCILPAALVLLAAPLAFAQTTAPITQTWRFDRVDQIGGYPTHVLGHPQIIDSEYGKAFRLFFVESSDPRSCCMANLERFK